MEKPPARAAPSMNLHWDATYSRAGVLLPARWTTYARASAVLGRVTWHSTARVADRGCRWPDCNAEPSLPHRRDRGRELASDTAAFRARNFGVVGRPRDGVHPSFGPDSSPIPCPDPPRPPGAGLWRTAARSGAPRQPSVAYEAAGPPPSPRGGPASCSPRMSRFAPHVPCAGRALAAVACSGARRRRSVDQAASRAQAGLRLALEHSANRTACAASSAMATRAGRRQRERRIRR